METPRGHEKNYKTSSCLIQASATINIAPQSQGRVPVHTKLHDLVVKETETNLFDKHE